MVPKAVPINEPSTKNPSKFDELLNNAERMGEELEREKSFVK